jgi:hypothetical protein
MSDRIWRLMCAGNEFGTIPGPGKVEIMQSSINALIDRAVVAPRRAGTDLGFQQAIVSDGPRMVGGNLITASSSYDLPGIVRPMVELSV